MSSLITVVDYGVGNICSVKRAFEQAGKTVEVTNEKIRIEKADKLVLPGVGAFPRAMKLLEEKNLIEPILSFIKKERPLLAICLGMQLLFQESNEFYLTKGLGLVEGEIIGISEMNKTDLNVKVPNIGWHPLKINQFEKFSSRLLNGIDETDFFYFVHSYMANKVNTNQITASIEYFNVNVPAVVEIKNIFGCQFHTEKSGKSGLKIVGNFAKI